MIGPGARLCIAIGFMLGAGGVHAQDVPMPLNPATAETLTVRSAPLPRGLRLRKPERVLFVTAAGVSANHGVLLGRTTGRNLLVASIQPAWQLAGSNRASVAYFTELIPLLLVTHNPTVLESLEDCARRLPSWQEVPRRVMDYLKLCSQDATNAYGVGLTPLGLTARLARPRGAGIVTEIAAGAVLFDKQTPYPRTTRLNYNVRIGTALELPLANGSVVSVGYRLQHLSNGGSGTYNPGVAAHLLQLGWGRQSIN